MRGDTHGVVAVDPRLCSEPSGKLSCYVLAGLSVTYRYSPFTHRLHTVYTPFTHLNTYLVLIDGTRVAQEIEEIRANAQDICR
jgi:hypothetical protein